MLPAVSRLSQITEPEPEPHPRPPRIRLKITPVFGRYTFGRLPHKSRLSPAVKRQAPSSPQGQTGTSSSIPGKSLLNSFHLFLKGIRYPYWNLRVQHPRLPGKCGIWGVLGCDLECPPALFPDKKRPSDGSFSRPMGLLSYLLLRYAFLPFLGYSGVPFDTRMKSRQISCAPSDLEVISSGYCVQVEYFPGEI